uniref:Unknown protein from spot 115 of 2D-PAGE of thylakoid (Fragments) n=1 Tax=Pisum sativum TaxID=3888 RepID=UT115_PEA|nr:RecName: Full=Unknown protein from spot 115 of 2D-PAGE of thylakoid [Pisum sativum]
SPTEQPYSSAAPLI